MLRRREWLARALLGGVLPALVIAGCATKPPPIEYRPIVFVHGNGDNAAVWQTTIWRFESNGWPRGLLHAVDLPYPIARDDDDKPQAGRSGTTEQMRALAGEVDKVLATTGARDLILIGSSRGANTIRNYIHNGGGSVTVRAVVLGGGVNHGVWNDPAQAPGSEFNGAGAFMKALNAPRGVNGEEAYPGIRWLTLRSDRNDKYAQPDGEWIGRKGMPTGIDFDAPALKGATNVVLPGLDHREVAFHPNAFGTAYTFITGQEPRTLDIVPEETVVLDGKVFGFGIANDPQRGSAPTNLPLAGATVEVFAVDPATGMRRGGARLRANIDAGGRWGPLKTDSRTSLEFVVDAPGYSTTHIYRSPFPRSSALVHLRPERLAESDRDAVSIVTLARPRGYLGVPRDRIELDGMSPPPGIPSGVPSVSSVTMKIAGAPGRAVAGEFNGERVVGRAWPASENRVVVLELHR